MNYTFQSALEAHNLDPWECVVLEELGRRGDQPDGIFIGGWRRLDVHGPVATCILQRTPHFVLQQFWEIGYILVHHEVWQITRIRPQPLQ